MAAVRPFALESRGASWWYLLSTLAILVGAAAIAVLAPAWPLRLLASVFEALVIVRVFILFHDFMHGAIFRDSVVGGAILRAFGLLCLTPPRSWRESHDYHHAHVGQLAASGVGSVPLWTVDQWLAASGTRRAHYRMSRHPLTMVLAYVTVFLWTITVEPLLRAPGRHWDSALAVAVHGGSIAALWWLGGPSAAIFGLILPFAIAAALGAYLFYAQHNFPGMRILPPAEWTLQRAALVSCSHMMLDPSLRWFTGDIGYHHVHHLNAAIPFYRLADAARAVPELRTGIPTSLNPRDILACLRLKLWDPVTEQMVGFRH